MKKSLTLILVGILLGSTVAFAASKFFSDVPANTWYSDEVASLSDKGIIAGYPDGTFGVTKNVNRAELAVILDRLIEYMETGEVAPSASTDKTKEEIVQKISEYCEEHNIQACSPETSYYIVDSNDKYQVVRVSGFNYLLTKKDNEWNVSVVSQEDDICETGSGNTDLVEYCSN